MLIKEFSEFNQFYKRCTNDEWKIVSGQWPNSGSDISLFFPMSDSELLELEKNDIFLKSTIIKPDNMGKEHWYPVYHFSMESNSNSRNSAYYQNSFQKRIDIHKSKDEYFYAHLTGEMLPYRCDQIDGLIKLIKDVEGDKNINESVYSMAARVAPASFSKPATNNEYIVKSVLIKFPDTSELSFDIATESYFSDKINYTIKAPQTKNWSIHQFFIEAFGDSIQMENYEEFVFVRCWNNPQDFAENDWHGYIFKSKNDVGFSEIDMKFNILAPNYTITPSNYSPDYFKNKFFDKQIMGIILSRYNQQLPNGIKYSELMKLKRKFETYLMGIGVRDCPGTDKVKEGNTIDLIDATIDGISLMTLIYALHIKDDTILKNLNIDGRLITNCPVDKLLDTIF